MVRLLACPACDCHAFATETHCPSCGSSLRDADGSIPRTAGAILLGLTLTANTVACGDSTGSGSGGGGTGGGGTGGTQMVSAYGVGPGGGSSVSGFGGEGGAGGTAGTGGAGGTATGGAGGN